MDIRRSRTGFESYKRYINFVFFAEKNLIRRVPWDTYNPGTPTTGGTPIDVSQPTDVAFRKEGKVGATTKKKKKKKKSVGFVYQSNSLNEYLDSFRFAF